MREARGTNWPEGPHEAGVTCLVSVECDSFLEEVTLVQGIAHPGAGDRGSRKGHFGQLGRWAPC